MKTTIEHDQNLIKDPNMNFTFRHYMAVKYRIENKQAFIQQIKAGKILTEILKRVQSLIPFEGACGRVFEYEEKSDIIMNRIILSKYLNQLKSGLDKNKAKIDALPVPIPPKTPMPQIESDEESDEESQTQISQNETKASITK